MPTFRSKTGAGPHSQWSTTDGKDSSQEEGALMQGTECFRHGEAMTCCAQPGTVHQFPPTSTAGANKAPGPPSNQHFTCTGAISGFQSPKSGGMDALLLISDSLSTSLPHPSPAIGIQHGATGSCGSTGQGYSRLGLAVVHSLPLPPRYHLNPDRVKPFQPLRK